MKATIRQKFNELINFFSRLYKTQAYIPKYRLVEIESTEAGDHFVAIQIINKNSVFKTAPEEILANNDLVDKFSPRDIRTLTYLGYLSINNPKYTILAQRLSEENDKLLFALQKKGEKGVIIKTADEIMKEKDILHNLQAKDANTIGYTAAVENMVDEGNTKKKLKLEKIST